MELDIINRLFLELSQIATATTRKELNYEAALRSILEAPADTDGTLSMRMRLIAKEALKGSNDSRARPARIIMDSKTANERRSEPDQAGSLDAVISQHIRERLPGELALGFARYEALRRLNPRQYRELHDQNMNGENFDRIVDALVLSNDPSSRTRRHDD